MKRYQTYQSEKYGMCLPYLLTLPDDFDIRQDRLPLILFLHGAGERGNDLERVCVHGIPKYFAADQHYMSLRVITLSPQCPEGEVWSHMPHLLYELLMSVVAAYHADPARLSITGLSMGGFGTWEMLSCYPDTFAAAAPICGGGMSWNINTTTPVRAFHGDNDPVVPLSYSEMMVDSLTARGGHAELTVYHGCGHDAWTQAYETSDVIPWLAGSVRAG
jgi:predicted peptidase